MFLVLVRLLLSPFRVKNYFITVSGSNYDYETRIEFSRNFMVVTLKRVNNVIDSHYFSPLSTFKIYIYVFLPKNL